VCCMKDYIFSTANLFSLNQYLLLRINWLVLPFRFSYQICRGNLCEAALNGILSMVSMPLVIDSLTANMVRIFFARALIDVDLL
jgi:hypothetical protein